MTLSQAWRALRGYRWFVGQLEHRLSDLPPDVAQMITMVALMDECRPLTPESDIHVRFASAKAQARSEERRLLAEMKTAVIEAASPSQEDPPCTN